MPIDPSTGAIAHAIQLAIAPVFLLTGVAGLLGVMAARLARVIDRARDIDATWSSMDASARATLRLEIRNLERRRRVCSWSINYCTTAALLVCLVIVTLFVEEFFATKLRLLAGALFVSAMVVLICGLTCFLREVYLATHTTNIDPTRFE
jgi:small-conductance mechanosensitive channel